MLSTILLKFKRFICFVFAIIMAGGFAFVLFWGINDVTGIFTYMYLEHKENVIERSKDPDLTKKMLYELIKDSKSVFMWKRRIAATEIGELGSRAVGIKSVLEELLNDKDYEVREAAKKALERIIVSNYVKEIGGAGK